MAVRKVNHRRRWRIVRSYALGWIAAFVFLSIVRGSGTVEEGSAQFGLPAALALSVAFGLVLGGLAGGAQVWIEERLRRRVSLRRLLAARALVAVLFLAAINLVAWWTVLALRGEPIGFVAFTFEPGSLAIFFYILCVDTALVGLCQVSLLLGEGNLWRLVRGEFYTPREEERIFMFVDLRSSTALAESLGHVRFSMLIQDCFDDLGVVAEHEAEIHAYSGDGVVLTWPLEAGLRDRNCIAAFFRFRERLASRSAHYLERYGREPVFTAGVNAGVVTVTEVGRFRKAIDYHGDAINTAARIQGKCGELGRDLLVSQTVVDALPDGAPGFVRLGSVRLRGREADVAIFAGPAPSALVAAGADPGPAAGGPGIP